jgi:hypothetical protein
VLDFWRVTELQRGKRLTLRAEMRLPGDAVLDFELVPIATAAGHRDAPHSDGALQAARAGRAPLLVCRDAGARPRLQRAAAGDLPGGGDSSARAAVASTGTG